MPPISVGGSRTFHRAVAATSMHDVMSFLQNGYVDYGFDEQTCRLALLSVHPGVTLDDVQANSSFEILIPEEVQTTEPPSPEVRRLLREIDPAGLVITKQQGHRA